MPQARSIWNSNARRNGHYLRVEPSGKAAENRKELTWRLKNGMNLGKGLMEGFLA